MLLQAIDGADAHVAREDLLGLLDLLLELGKEHIPDRNLGTHPQIPHARVETPDWARGGAELLEEGIATIGDVGAEEVAGYVECLEGRTHHDASLFQSAKSFRDKK